VLSLISIAITTLFLVEIPLSLWALGSEFYNPYGRVPHASLHLFDAVIIVTTFVLEVILRGKERELAGLLVVLRLWRLLKLVGGERDPFFFLPSCLLPSRDVNLRDDKGVAVGAGELEENTYKDLARVKKELEDSRFALVRAQDENQELQARIAWLESHATPVS